MRSQFPLLKTNKKLIYLDSAATTQLPRSVILAMRHYLTHGNANIHRGQYPLSLAATELYEKTRTQVATHLNASDYTVVMTSGTTAAIAQLIFGLAPLIKKGDTVLVAQDNHHSNFVGWQRLCAERKAKLDIIPVDNEGRLKLDEYKQLLAKKPKMVAISHVSNVTGVIHPVKEICRAATKVKTITVIDGAQAVAHTAVDIKQLNCDFYVFSGHKLFGPTGIGALIGRTGLLDKMEPLITGGGMIGEVTNRKSSWAPLPSKLEAGTPNILGAVGLGTAINWWHGQPQDKLFKQEAILTSRLLQALSRIPGISIVGPKDTQDRVGVVSFYHSKIHAHDLAEILAGDNVAVRAGHHCAMPLHKVLGTAATVRVSFGPYNNKRDVVKLIRSLKKGIAKLS